MLELMPISLADANSFVTEHHRHHKPVRGHKFLLGCMVDGRLVGVAMVYQSLRQSHTASVKRERHILHV